MGSSSSKEEKREKKGRKEQEGDKIKITSGGGVFQAEPSNGLSPKPDFPFAVAACGTLSSCLAQHHHLPSWVPTCHYHPHTHTHAPIMNEYSVRDLQAFTSSSVRVG